MKSTNVKKNNVRTDVSEVDLVQIETCLSPPDIPVQNDRVTNFEFDYCFSADVKKG